MSDEVKPETNAGTQIPKVEAPPPKVEAKVETPPPKVEAKVEPKTGANVATEKKRTTLKDEDDPEKLPDDVEVLELTPRALKNRLTRHANKTLKDRFGTDDIEEIAKQIEEAKTLKADQEKERVAKLSEQDKLKEDNAKLKKELDDERTARAQERTSHAVEKIDKQIIDIGAKHVDPEYVEDQLPGLARYLKKNLDKKQIAKGFDSKEVRKATEDFFKDLVKRKPKLAKEGAPPKVEVEKVTSGADTNGRKESGSQQGTTKDMRPGKENSMSRGEARASAAKEGFHW